MDAIYQISPIRWLLTQHLASNGDYPHGAVIRPLLGRLVRPLDIEDFPRFERFLKYLAPLEISGFIVQKNTTIAEGRVGCRALPIIHRNIWPWVANEDLLKPLKFPDVCGVYNAASCKIVKKIFQKLYQIVHHSGCDVCKASSITGWRLLMGNLTNGHQTYKTHQKETEHRKWHERKDLNTRSALRRRVDD